MHHRLVARTARALIVPGLLLAAPGVSAQSTTSPATEAIVTGLIRISEGVPLGHAYVQSSVYGRAASADGEGRYLLRIPLAAGTADTVRLVARGIGYGRVDTLLHLRAGDRVVWDLTLTLAPSLAERRQVQTARAAAGQVDSMAAGHVKTDTTTAFTFERFGLELLRAALDSSTADSNRVLSPSSAGQALTVAWRAAVDSSAIVIGRALHAGALDATGLAARTRPFRVQAATRDDITLRFATALWVDTSEALQPAFATWVRDHADATARTIPLHTERAVAVVNAWADSATNGRIRRVREEPFTEGVKVVLADAVYLKSEWLVPFDSALTEHRPFATARGRRVRVPTMERIGELAHRQEPGYQVLRVPYRAGLTAMYLVLPDSGVSPRAVLDSIARTGWPVPDTTSERRRVQLRLPRVHVEQGTKLRPAFSALGLGILFDGARADFGGLLVAQPHRPPPCPPISAGPRLDSCTLVRLSEATQNVFLDVNEVGTEAAAVTVLEFEVVVVSAPPPPLEFFVDRPFLFAIRDERTGTLLFVGYIADPRG